MSAEPRQLLLCVGDELQRPEEPAATMIRRVRTCGCVEVGRWMETSEPPIRWWIKRTVRLCGAHMPRVRGGANR